MMLAEQIFLVPGERPGRTLSWMHLEQDERSEKDWVSKKD
jgi:hypothetical protein